jgi:hypothetical protein
MDIADTPACIKEKLYSFIKKSSLANQQTVSKAQKLTNQGCALQKEKCNTWLITIASHIKPN